MHVLVLSHEPASQVPIDTGSLPSILDQLGCRVTEMDVGGDLSAAAIEPDVIIVDTGDDMGAARRAREAISRSALADVPVLLAVGVPRLASIDFSLGFADFVLRPFVPPELYARLRQIDWKTSAFGSADAIKLGDLAIDLAGREVTVGARPVKLTPQEFELLRFLAENLGRALERDEILRKVWGYAGGPTRTVDIHIRRLRAKLGPPWDQRIETVRNVGYKLRA